MEGISVKILRISETMENIIMRRVMKNDYNIHRPVVILHEDASRDPRSVETRIHAKRGNPTFTTCSTDRRGYAQWLSSLVRICAETRRKQCHPQSDGTGNTRFQTTRTSQEDVAPTTQGRHDGRG